MEAGAAKTHRKLSTPVVSESARLSVEPIVAKKAKTAVATADTAGSAAIGDAVGVIAPVQPEIEKIGLDIAEVGTPHEIPHEEIARLAHSYWVARGYSHGSSVEDWLRAEEELRAKR